MLYSLSLCNKMKLISWHLAYYAFIISQCNYVFHFVALYFMGIILYPVVPLCVHMLVRVIKKMDLNLVAPFTWVEGTCFWTLVVKVSSSSEHCSSGFFLSGVCNSDQIQQFKHFHLNLNKGNYWQKYENFGPLPSARFDKQKFTPVTLRWKTAKHEDWEKSLFVKTPLPFYKQWDDACWSNGVGIQPNQCTSHVTALVSSFFCKCLPNISTVFVSNWMFGEGWSEAYAVKTWTSLMVWIQSNLHSLSIYRAAYLLKGA